MIFSGSICSDRHGAVYFLAPHHYIIGDMIHIVKMRRYLFGSLFVVVLAAGGLVIRMSEDEFVSVTIKNIAVRVEVVASETERVRGLSGRNILPKDGGMLFLFEKPDYHGIWMKDMKFPIDILWLSEDRVVDIEERVPSSGQGSPLTSLPVYAPDMPVRFVLEVNAGFVEQHGIRIGDPIKIPWLDVGFPDGPPQQKSTGGNSASKEGVPHKPSGHEFFIETLRELPPEGNDFSIQAQLPGAPAYDSFLISYKSGDLVLSGIMTVPRGAVPDGGYPVLILNHGLIYPSIYYSGRGSRRERDFFARNGYVTIHPDYRGYGVDAVHSCPLTLSWTSELEGFVQLEAMPLTGCKHDFYVGYTVDVVNLVDALRRAQLPYVDLQRIGMWGHSMGGGIAARVAVLRPDIRAYVLFAPISADVEDNFYELPDEETSRLAQVYGTGGAARGRYDEMSPLAFFEDVAAPIQLHHGNADKDVPIEFSEKMYMKLQELGKTAEFFVYPGQEHEFVEDWQLATERSLQFFDLYVKGAR